MVPTKNNNTRYYIYCISSNKSERLYIGSSNNPMKRFKEHVRKLHAGKHHSYKLQEHFNLTKPTLTLKILCECKREDIEWIELALIIAFNTVVKGFNVRYSTIRK